MNPGSLRPLVGFIDNNFKISCHFYLFVYLSIYLLIYIFTHKHTHSLSIYIYTQYTHYVYGEYVYMYIYMYIVHVYVYARAYWRTEINLGYCYQVPFSWLSETQILPGLPSLFQPLTPSMTLVSREMGSQYFLSPLTPSVVKDIMNFRLLTDFIKTCRVPPC